MADRDQFDTSTRGTAEKPRRDNTGKGDVAKEREHGVKPGGTVGRDVPDESKERHTEIAVGAGHKGGPRHSDNR